MMLVCTSTAQPDAFTYQGRLTENGAPASGSNDLRFVLFDALTNGNQISTNITFDDVQLTNGLFTVALDWGAGVFDGSERWLEVRVRAGNAGGAYTALSPRQRITSAPYALHSGSASNLLGTLPDAQLSANVSLLGQTIDSTEIVNGSIVNADISGSAAIADTKLATISTAGKVDNSATTAASGNTANAIVARDANGGFAAGDIAVQRLSGGVNHQLTGNLAGIGAGNGNTNQGLRAFIAGGLSNFIQTNAGGSFIGGGQINVVQGNSTSAFIGGGEANSIASDRGVIGGGQGNSIATNAGWAVIPGGRDNAVTGDYGLAAGRRAKANQSGTFVWADAQNADFASSSSNTFLLRAQNGVGINTNNPQTALHVNGIVTASGFSGAGSGLTSLPAGNLTGTLPASVIAAGTINSDMLAAGSVGAVQLADGAVTQPKFATNLLTPVLTIQLVSAKEESLLNLGGSFGRPLSALGSDRVVVGASEKAHLMNLSGTILVTMTNPTTSTAGSFCDAIAAVGVNRILVGDPDNDTPPYGGKAFLFNTNGSLVLTITNPFPNFDFNNHFGFSVANVDGGRFLIADSHSGLAGDYTGIAFLYSTNGTRLATLTSPAPAYLKGFGSGLAAVGGKLLAVGENRFAGVGAVHLYDTNGNWLNTITNPVNQPYFGSVIEPFGADRFLVGDKVSPIGSGGAAFLYSTNGALLAVFQHPFGQIASQFGQSLAALGTDKVVVGSGSTSAFAGNPPGQVFVFDTNGLFLTAISNPATTNTSGFGTAVAAVGAGNLVVGAPWAYRGSGFVTDGAAYVFQFTNGFGGLRADSIAVAAVTSASIADGAITDADVSVSAGIIDAKLATISTPGKVANSATTATSSNLPNTVVLRDATGSFNAGQITATSFTGNGASLTNLSFGSFAAGSISNSALANGAVDSAKILDGTIATNDLSSALLDATFWKLGGNTGITSAQFLGTRDSQLLDLRVNGQTALRLLDNGDSDDPGTTPDGAPNVIAGAAPNSVAAGVVGAVIGGGGATNYQGSPASNSVAANYAVIGGGLNNTVQSGAVFSSLKGGLNNTIRSNSAYASVGGGFSNVIAQASLFTVIGGGGQNSVQTGADAVTIGGGSANVVQADADTAVIGGGSANVIESNALFATIAGGATHVIGDSAAGAFVGGGFRNQNSAAYGVIAGGSYNALGAATGAGLVAGVSNVVESGSTGALLGGGNDNQIQSGGVNTTLVGGKGNVIQPNAQFATLGGGAFNTVGRDAVSTVVVGGTRNTNLAMNGFIGGGAINLVATNAALSAIVGGSSNSIQAGASYSAIVGGGNNTIETNGTYNSLGGGFNNTIAAGANYATIPGGRANTASADYAFAAGRRAGANHAGTFVWADSQNAAFNSTGTNQFLIRAAGGVGINKANPASALDVAGTVTANTFNGAFVGNFSGNGSGLSNVVATLISTNSDLVVERVMVGRSNVLTGAYSSIGGGFGNTNDSDRSTIAGGTGNYITDFLGDAAFIGGGENNVISDGGVSTVSGGRNNRIYHSDTAAIGGGTGNIITNLADGSVIAGGSQNGIGSRTLGGSIGGGNGNFIGADASGGVIAGGNVNSISNNSAFAVVAGGQGNTVGVDSIGGAIGGGYANQILANSTVATIPGGSFNSATNSAFAAGSRAKAIHLGAFVWGDTFAADVASTNANSVTMRASGGYRLFSDGSATAGVALPASGTAWAVMSDRNMKKDFAGINAVDILEKLSAMPITQWHYNWETAETTPHLGPMAQDFKAAFYPGSDDKSITTLEADGVAFAAIQGLNEKVEGGTRKTESRIQKLEAENAALKARLERLEALLTTQK